NGSDLCGRRNWRLGFSAGRGVRRLDVRRLGRSAGETDRNAEQAPLAIGCFPEHFEIKLIGGGREKSLDVQQTVRLDLRRQRKLWLQHDDAGHVELLLAM